MCFGLCGCNFWVCFLQTKKKYFNFEFVDKFWYLMKASLTLRHVSGLRDQRWVMPWGMSSNVFLMMMNTCLLLIWFEFSCVVSDADAEWHHIPKNMILKRPWIMIHFPWQFAGEGGGWWGGPPFLETMVPPTQQGGRVCIGIDPHPLGQW